MRIAWLTDIHLEWLNQKSRKAFFEAVASERPDVVLLGGDICNHDFLEPWLVKLQKKVQAPIFFCLGNHDFYHSSISEVRELARTITANHDQIVWLPACGIVTISDDIGLLGHGCWGDGWVGSFFKSPLSLNDFRYIQELAGLGKHDQLEQVRRLGSEAADYLAIQVGLAAQRFDKVVVLTHVPPFPEACLYMGKPSEEGLPFFCCKAAGDALRKVAANNPETQFLVLSGHTHDAADVQIADNLRCVVAEAVYGRPDFRILEVPEFFHSMSHDEWFRREVEKALDEADDPDAVWISHDEVSEGWRRRREELVKSVERGLSELRSGQGEDVKDDDTFFEDLRKRLKKRGDGEDIEPEPGG